MTSLLLLHTKPYKKPLNSDKRIFITDCSETAKSVQQMMMIKLPVSETSFKALL